MTNLVIQSFGRENEFKRAILTILSFYAHTLEPLKETRILLFTDDPGYFKAYLNELPVTYIKLTPAKISEMRGAINFLHRMKIALIEEAFGMINGPMLYVDSDTFFTGDPTPLINQVSAQISFMHTREYQFKEKEHVGTIDGPAPFFSLIKNNDFYLSDQSRLQVSTELYSWNAGVMFLHASHKTLLKDVYALTEQFYQGTESHASEQYAFSVMLQLNTQVVACERIIYHYWYKTKKEIIDIFLDKNINEQLARLPTAEKISKARDWTKVLPDYLENHILNLKYNAIVAFGDNRYADGYTWAGKALLKEPFGDLPFIKDVLYYTKRRIINK